MAEILPRFPTGRGRRQADRPRPEGRKGQAVGTEDILLLHHHLAVAILEVLRLQGDHLLRGDRRLREGHSLQEGRCLHHYHRLRRSSSPRGCPGAPPRPRRCH